MKTADGHKFVIEHRIADAWENVSSEGGAPLGFPTREEAAAELATMLRDRSDAGMEESRDDWRVMPTDPHERCRCEDCGWSGEVDALHSVDDMADRWAAGDVMWDGDCPECGSLVHCEARHAEWDAEREATRSLAARLKDALDALRGLAHVAMWDKDDEDDHSEFDAALARAQAVLNGSPLPDVVKVRIVIDGGCLSDVQCDAPGAVAVQLWDIDNIKGGDPEPTDDDFDFPVGPLEAGAAGGGLAGGAQE